MVKAVAYEAHGGEDRFPAGPRAHLSWFQSGRNRLGSCNRFEELKANFHSVQFSERAEFCDRFLLKCVSSSRTNLIRYG